LLPTDSDKAEDDVMAEGKPLFVRIPPDLRRELDRVAASSTGRCAI
jgi:hypothetical protein